MTSVKIKLLSPLATLPKRATEGAAAYDLCAAEDVVIESGTIAKIKLGFAVEVPPEFFVYVRPRSGIATKHGLDLCSSGIVDSDYRGEVHLPLINHSKEPQFISARDRIGQMVILPVPQTCIVECNDLSTTNRGTGGFGSTGK